MKNVDQKLGSLVKEDQSSECHGERLAALPHQSAVAAWLNSRDTRNGWGTYAVIETVQRTPVLNVQGTTAPPVAEADVVMLLSTSDRFLFVFDRARNRSRIVAMTRVGELQLCQASKPFFGVGA